MRELLQNIPSLGLLIAALLSSKYTFFLISQVNLMNTTEPSLTSLSILISILSGLTTILLFLISFGLFKRNNFTYKVGIIITVISFISLFRSPDISEIIILISGFFLFLNRKLYASRDK